jgi:hypothetical protein
MMIETMSMTPTILRWSSTEEQPHSSGPMSLAPHEGRILHVHVESDQIALVLCDHDISTVLLDGHHFVDVVAKDDWPYDEGLDRDAELTVPRSIEADSCLLFLDQQWILDLELDIEKGPGAAFSFTGRGQMRIANPVRFYASFLRNTEDLEAEELQRVATAILRDCLKQLVDARGDSSEPFAAGELRDVELSLAEVGLELLDLQIDPGADEAIESNRAPELEPAVSEQRLLD